jgi:hypothetical protein
MLRAPPGCVAHPERLHAFIYGLMETAEHGRQFVFKAENLGHEIAVIRARNFPSQYQSLARPAYYSPDRAAYDFHLRAAPHKKGPNGKIVRIAAADPDDDDAAYLRWLENRATNFGFRLLEPPILTRRARPIRSKGALVVAECDYVGRLEVLDRGRFEAALEHGIGPRKAYGYGFLTLY